MKVFMQHGYCGFRVEQQFDFLPSIGDVIDYSEYFKDEIIRLVSKYEKVKKSYQLEWHLFAWVDVLVDEIKWIALNQKEYVPVIVIKRSIDSNRDEYENSLIEYRKFIERNRKK